MFTLSFVGVKFTSEDLTDFGRCVDAHGKKCNLLLARDDLAGYQPEWQEPIDASYRGLTIKTIPPNSEGFQILQTLKILESQDLEALGHNSADYIHLVSEAIKLATADRIRWAGDPKFDEVPVDRLLAEEYIAGRRTLIDPDRASRSEGERWRRSADHQAIAPALEGLAHDALGEALPVYVGAVDEGASHIHGRVDGGPAGRLVRAAPEDGAEADAGDPKVGRSEGCVVHGYLF